MSVTTRPHNTYALSQGSLADGTVIKSSDPNCKE